MPRRLYFTESDDANALIASDPMALLVGFALDQQVTVQKAFAGPLAIRERLGSLDAATLAEADLDTVFRERPAVHRYPGVMAKRVHDLAVHIEAEYGGDPPGCGPTPPMAMRSARTSLPCPASAR